MKNTISGNEARGFMKILVDAKTDTVIGVHMIGPDCAEIMQASPLHCYASHMYECHIGDCSWLQCQPMTVTKAACATDQ